MAVMNVNGISIIEKPMQEGSIQFKGPTAKRVYALTGSTQKLAIQIAVITAAPQTETSISSTGQQLSLFLDKVSVKEIGGGVWEATCDYADTPQQFDLKFNIGTQTVKRQQALEHIATYDCILGGVLMGDGAFTSGIPDFNGAIGVSETEVAGVDVEIAKIEFTITLRLNTANPIGFDGQPLSPLYFWQVANITPCVNATDLTIIYKGQTFLFPKGSVLFRGAPMSTNSDTQLDITFMFAYSKNLTATAADWVSTETYQIGSQVTYNGYLFTSTMVGNLDNAPIGNAWSTSATYQVGDLVIFNGAIYEALQVTTGNQPNISAAQWNAVGSSSWTPNGPSVPALVVGASDPIIKEGWWYAWPWYKTGTSGGTAHPLPTAIVVDRVYDYGDLALLEIPSTTN
jgi:hypothetical protein